MECVTGEGSRKDAERERERESPDGCHPSSRVAGCESNRDHSSQGPLVLPPSRHKSFGPLRMGRDPNEQITLFISRTGRTTAARSTSFQGDEDA